MANVEWEHDGYFYWEAGSEIKRFKLEGLKADSDEVKAIQKREKDIPSIAYRIDRSSVTFAGIGILGIVWSVYVAGLFFAGEPIRGYSSTTAIIVALISAISLVIGNSVYNNSYNISQKFQKREIESANAYTSLNTEHSLVQKLSMQVFEGHVVPVSTISAYLSASSKLKKLENMEHPKAKQYSKTLYMLVNKMSAEHTVGMDASQKSTYFEQLQRKFESAISTFDEEYDRISNNDFQKIVETVSSEGYVDTKTIDESKKMVAGVKAEIGQLRGDIIWVIDNPTFFDPYSPISSELFEELAKWDDILNNPDTATAETLHKISENISKIFATSKKESEKIGLYYLHGKSKETAAKASKLARKAKSTDSVEEHDALMGKVAELLSGLVGVFIPEPTMKALEFYNPAAIEAQLSSEEFLKVPASEDFKIEEIVEAKAQ